MNNVSYIKLIEWLSSFCDNHLQIQKYYFENKAQMPNLLTKDEKYPAVFFELVSMTFNESYNSIEMNIYCYDVLEKDRENYNTIISDTAMILNDIFKFFINGGLDSIGVQVIASSNVTPLNNDLLDYCAGNLMTISFDLDTYSACDLPTI